MNDYDLGCQHIADNSLPNQLDLLLDYFLLNNKSVSKSNSQYIEKYFNNDINISKFISAINHSNCRIDNVIKNKFINPDVISFIFKSLNCMIKRKPFISEENYLRQDC